MLTPFLEAAYAHPSPIAFARFRRLQKELSVVDADLPDVADTVDGFEALFAFQEEFLSGGGELPVQSGPTRIVGTQQCYFSEAAYCDNRVPGYENGTLYLCDASLIFWSDGSAETAWSEVSQIVRDQSTLSVYGHGRRYPLILRLHRIGDALRAEFIVRKILARTTAERHCANTG